MLIKPSLVSFIIVNLLLMFSLTGEYLKHQKKQKQNGAFTQAVFALFFATVHIPNNRCHY